MDLPPPDAPGSAPVQRDLDAHERVGRGYGPLQQRIFRWAFGPVTYPGGASEHLRRAADRGPIVYVGRSSSLVAFVFFQHLFLRIGAPIAQAVTGLGWQIWGWWGRFLAGRRAAGSAPPDEDARG